MNTVVSNWLNMFYQIINGFFTLEIVSGVTYGGFILAVFIFSIVISFLFRKIFRW